MDLRLQREFQAFILSNQLFYQVMDIIMYQYPVQNATRIKQNNSNTSQTPNAYCSAKIYYFEILMPIT